MTSAGGRVARAPGPVRAPPTARPAVFILRRRLLCHIAHLLQIRACFPLSPRLPQTPRRYVHDRPPSIAAASAQPTRQSSQSRLRRFFPEAPKGFGGQRLSGWRWFRPPAAPAWSPNPVRQSATHNEECTWMIDQATIVTGSRRFPAFGHEQRLLPRPPGLVTGSAMCPAASEAATCVERRCTRSASRCCG